jgi:hypothetical protein
MTNSKNGPMGFGARGAYGAQDALGVFMARSIAVVEGLKSRGGDGLSESLRGLEEAESVLRGLGASGYFIAKVSRLVIDAMSDNDHRFNGTSVDISYFADFLSGGSKWDA